MLMKKILAAGLAAMALSPLAMAVSPTADAAEYQIDKEGQHAFIEFRIQHLGYSWLLGQFRDFDGSFSYDPDDLTASAAEVTIHTDSLDTNHAERDKHLKSADFLNVSKFPEARFVSTGFEPEEGESDEGVLKGDLTLHGVTRPVEIEVTRIGGGDDPWGGYRQGFEGETEFKLADFNIDPDNHLGPASETVHLYLSLEGVRQ